MQEWLFASGGCSRAYDLSQRSRVQFQHGPVKAYIEEMPVLPGISLYRSEATGRSRFSIEVPGGPADCGRLILGTMLAGRGTMRMHGTQSHDWHDDGRAYLLTPIERPVSYAIDAARGWRSVAIKLEAQALDIIGADGTMPDLARNALQARLGNAADMAPLPSALRSLAHLLLREPYEGPMRQIFRQAKVLEMLAHHFDRIGGADTANALSSPELVRVRLARDRLLADLRDPPDLDALARDVGLSPRRLNRGFKALYGVSCFNYLRDARLDAARAALEAGTPLSLKQLAFELGYAQVTNFVTAFRRRFGVPPGAYRRGSPDPHAGYDGLQ